MNYLIYVFAFIFFVPTVAYSGSAAEDHWEKNTWNYELPYENNTQTTMLLLFRVGNSICPTDSVFPRNPDNQVTVEAGKDGTFLFTTNCKSPLVEVYVANQGAWKGLICNISLKPPGIRGYEPSGPNDLPDRDRDIESVRFVDTDEHPYKCKKSDGKLVIDNK